MASGRSSQQPHKRTYERTVRSQPRNGARPGHHGAEGDTKEEPVLETRLSSPNCHTPTLNTHPTHSSLDRRSRSGTAPTAKREPDLAVDHAISASTGASYALVFQQLGSTDISPSVTSDPVPTGRGHDMKESLAGFLRVISRTSRGEENIHDILTNAQATFKRAEDIAGQSPTSRKSGGVDVGDATNRRRRKARQRKYYVIDPKRNANSKRRRPETPELTKEEVVNDTTEEGSMERIFHRKKRRVRRIGNSEDELEGDSDEETANIDAPTSSVTGAAHEESDMDPDEVDLDAEVGFKRTSPRIVCKPTIDRDIRAQRRAAEAEGDEVPASLMINRKPAMKDHKNEVALKVREARKSILYTFVKSREAKLKDLREELELVAELPRHLKFELEYQKKVIRDSDTPASLGILYTGRFKARRKERLADDSSDGVTEVERKRQRRNLLKVTIQDEKGKKHDFQHDRDTKLGSMFRAFARLCQNNVFSYRFFFDGVRLNHDDKPADCADFEDGAFIDAFFEAQGGTSIFYRMFGETSIPPSSRDLVFW